MGVGSNVYSGAASFGRVYAIFSAVLASLLALGLLIAGVMLLRKPNKFLKNQNNDQNAAGQDSPNKNPGGIMSHTLAWWLIGIAFVILVASWGWVWMTQESKAAAAVEGGVAAAGLIRGAL